jgi:hypothetical protein
VLLSEGRACLDSIPLVGRHLSRTRCFNADVMCFPSVEEPIRYDFVIHASVRVSGHYVRVNKLTKTLTI